LVRSKNEVPANSACDLFVCSWNHSTAGGENHSMRGRLNTSAARAWNDKITCPGWQGQPGHSYIGFTDALADMSARASVKFFALPCRLQAAAEN
jgi:hypothetical protein